MMYLAVRTWSISLSADSKSIATGTFAGTVDIYSLETGVQAAETWGIFF
jgi:hypothetical protein